MALLKPGDMQAIQSASRANGLNPMVMAALVLKESAGKFSWTGNRIAIRQEGHYFYRLLPPDQRKIAVRAGLASPRMGAVKVPNSASARYSMLRLMQKINHDVALMSISMGAGQVMGAHWKRLGYASVEAMWQDAQTAPGQIRQMCKFVATDARLKKAINALDYKTIALLYNGKGYRKNRYDTELRRLYTMLNKNTMVTAYGGFPIENDNGWTPEQYEIFGKGIDVREFQERRGLVPDGDIGPITKDELTQFEQEVKDAEPKGTAVAVATAGAGGAGLLGTIAASSQDVQDTLWSLYPVTNMVSAISENAERIVGAVSALVVLFAIGAGIYKWMRKRG